MSNTPTQYRILGVDPGLNITGYAVLGADGAKPKIIEAGIVRGTQRDSLTQRLLDMHTGIADIIKTYQPNVLAVEQLYSHYARPRTAILMGHARGVICLAAAQVPIPVVHYPATRVKRMMTGNGRASKIQVQKAVQQALQLAQLPEPPDVADALGIALCHFHLSLAQARMAGKTKPG